MKKHKHDIIEKKLGIPGDYQYTALTGKNFVQANWHGNKLEAIRQVCKLNKKTAILDLGTGSGNFEIEFGKKVKQITGVDYHQEALDFLSMKIKQKKLKNIRLIREDIRHLNRVKDLGMYDLVVMIDVIEHIKIEEAEKLVKFLKKSLLPGGQVCIITPNYLSPWIYIEKLLDRVTIVPHFEGEQHLAKYHHANLRKLFQKNGFSESRVSSFNLLSFLIPNKKISSFLCRVEISSNIPFGNLLLGSFKNEKE